jgi:hypothetical protein
MEGLADLFEPRKELSARVAWRAHRLDLRSNTKLSKNAVASVRLECWWREPTIRITFLVIMLLQPVVHNRCMLLTC